MNDQTMSDFEIYYLLLTQMTEEFKALYDDNVVVQIVTLPRSVSQNLIRKTRSLLQEDGEDKVCTSSLDGLFYPTETSIQKNCGSLFCNYFSL